MKMCGVFFIKFDLVDCMILVVKVKKQVYSTLPSEVSSFKNLNFCLQTCNERHNLEGQVLNMYKSTQQKYFIFIFVKILNKRRYKVIGNTKLFITYIEI